MKKTIISIIGIAVMLLAITACRPNYVIVPIPGGGTSSTPSGTPVANLGELKAVLAKGDEARLEDHMQVSAADLADLEAGTINGDGNKIIVTDTTTASGTKSGLYLKGVSVKDAIIDVSTATRASVTYDDTTYAVMIQGEGTTLENVEIITGGKAGINVHSASNVELKNVTIDDCAKAPVSISSSTVTIDGITANGSSWYRDNVIQVNGLKGYPAHEASTITFKSTGNIDRVWVEAVAADYNAAGDITDSNFNTGDQTVIEGLDWEVRYSDQASKSVKGWTYYKSDAEATTFTLNKENASLADDELVAMIAAVKGSVAKDHAYDVIKLSQDVTLDSQLVIDTPVTIDGADSFTISRAKTPSEDAEGTKAAILITSSDVTLKDLTVSGPNTTPTDWDDGEYAIKAYGTTEEQLENVVLENVTIEEANAGMLVRGADVTLKGDIVLNNLEWGGISVDCKSDDGSLIYDCKLTVASDCSVTGELSDVPAIWTEHGTEIPEGGSEDVVVNGSGVDAKRHHTGDNKNQYWYNLASDTSSNN